jgi:DNA repair protein RecO (recombination protein O)
LGLHKSQALVLNTYPLGNSDKIVIFFSRDFGKIRGIASGAQRPKSKFAGRFETGNWIELLFFEKEINELVKIDDAELLSSFSHHLKDYEQFLSLSLVMEILIGTLPDCEKNDANFRLVLLTLKTLQDPGRVHLARLYFEIWYLKLAGLFPGSRHCCNCRHILNAKSPIIFDLGRPGFCCAACAGGNGIHFSEEMFGLLRRILESPLDQLLPPKSDEPLRNLMKLMDKLLERSFERNFESLQLLNSQV